MVLHRADGLHGDRRGCRRRLPAGAARRAGRTGAGVCGKSSRIGPWYSSRHTMPEFVSERDIPGAGPMIEEQIRDVSVRSLEVLRGIGPQIQWLHSYVTDDRIHCVYLAPDEASVYEHARRLGVPANRVSAVRRLIDPKRYS